MIATLHAAAGGLALAALAGTLAELGATLTGVLGVIAGVLVLALFLAGATAPLWNRGDDR